MHLALKCFLNVLCMAGIFFFSSSSFPIKWKKIKIKWRLASSRPFQWTTRRRPVVCYLLFKNMRLIHSSNLLWKFKKKNLCSHSLRVQEWENGLGRFFWEEKKFFFKVWKLHLSHIPQKVTLFSFSIPPPKKQSLKFKSPVDGERLAHIQRPACSGCYTSFIISIYFPSAHRVMTQSDFSPSCSVVFFFFGRLSPANRPKFSQMRWSSSFQKSSFFKPGGSLFLVYSVSSCNITGISASV